MDLFAGDVAGEAAADFRNEEEERGVDRGDGVAACIIVFAFG